MPRRNTEFTKGESYHLFNRGNNSQKIFLIAENYFFFLDCLITSLPSSSVSIHAFCFLPNHYHISLRLEEAIDVSDAMKNFQRTYAKAFNTRFRRHGHVFENRFKSIHIESADYLDFLSRYIHRNPIEAGLAANPEDWQFSSYLSYLNGEPFKGMSYLKGMPVRKTGGWKVPAIDPSNTLGRFRTRNNYREFVLCDWERYPWQLENGLWTPMGLGGRIAEVQPGPLSGNVPGEKPGIIPGI
jgi:putative transposase